ncbi:MAG: hypothetical protein KF809_16575 [Chloroflexi bacterium]|nr:hypothetical protein [Chloroflexota bacterium]
MSGHALSTPIDSPDMTDAYLAMLRDIGAAAGRMGDRPLTSHWPLAGARYRPGGLLVIGHAVFGWIPEWQAADVATETGAREVLSASRAAIEGDDPMAWITTARARSSPFWRVVRDVVDGLTPEGPPWYSRIAWTTLYPVAPNAPKGNPTPDQCDVQRPAATRFLAATIEVLDPSVVLVLGGGFWWGYRDGLALDLEPAERPLFEVGVVDGRRWIAGWHPGGANRRHWLADRYAAHILGMLADLR